MAFQTALFALATLALALLASAAGDRRRSGGARFDGEGALHLSAVVRAARYPTVGSKKQIGRARKEYRAAVTQAKRWAKLLSKLSKRAARPRAKQSVKVAAKKAKIALLAAEKRRNIAHQRLKALRFRPGRGKVIISGQKLPTTCFCKRAPAGESKCYFYTRGRFCSARYCAAKFECVGKKQARGALCSLRKVNTRVVPTRRGRCKTKYIQSYMYVPYYM